MRVTSDIWVHVFLRRESQRGAFATVVQTGASEAGAIYCVENHLADEFNLYAPAPQTFLSDEVSDRMFELVLQNVKEIEVDTYLARQKKFDPDIWIIETQCREGPPSLEMVKPIENSQFFKNPRY